MGGEDKGQWVFFPLIPLTHLLSPQICESATQTRKGKTSHTQGRLCQINTCCILQSKSQQKQRRSHEASYNVPKCGVSNPTGRPAAIGACSGAREKLAGDQKVHFNRGRKRAGSSCARDQSSVRTSHTEKARSLSFAAPSHTKAEVRIRYESLGGW